MIFTGTHIDCGYGKIRILHDISLQVSSGEAFCLLGPNGVGKTTLFKTILGFLPLLSGLITIDGEDISTWSDRRKAQVIGYVPQVHTPPFPFTVIDVVTMGRTAHLGPMASPSKHDVEIAEDALKELGISNLSQKIYTEISGGERQMVLVARALAQQPKILIMDEPTANLDFGNQVRVLEQINRLTAQGMAIIMTTHFPDHAFLCPGTVGLLEHDRLTVGRAQDVVTEERLQCAYGVDVRIIQHAYLDVGLLRSCIPIVSGIAKSKIAEYIGAQDQIRNVKVHKALQED